MKVEVKAVIQSISEVTETKTGGKWLNFRAKTEEDYSQVIEVKIFKKKEYAEHADNFGKYNKVGDLVQLELSVQCSTHEPTGRIFTNLNLWKCTKIEGETPTPPAPITSGDKDDLPF